MAVRVDLGDAAAAVVVGSVVKAVELIVAGARIRRVDVVLQLIKNLMLHNNDFDDEDLKG